MLIKLDKFNSKVEYVNYDAITGFNTELISRKDNLYRVRLYCYVSEPSVHNAYILYESDTFHNEKWDGYDTAQEYLDVYNSMLGECEEVLHAILIANKMGDLVFDINTIKENEHENGKNE